MIKILHVDDEQDWLKILVEQLADEPQIEVKSLLSLEQMEKENLKDYSLVILDGFRGEGWKKALELIKAGIKAVVVTSGFPSLQWHSEIPYISKATMVSEKEKFLKKITALIQ